MIPCGLRRLTRRRYDETWRGGAYGGSNPATSDLYCPSGGSRRRGAQAGNHNDGEAELNDDNAPLLEIRRSCLFFVLRYFVAIRVCSSHKGMWPYVREEEAIAARAFRWSPLGAVEQVGSTGANSTVAVRNAR